MTGLPPALPAGGNDMCPPKLGDIAPDFTARTTQGSLTFSDLRGSWVLLFSHPADFTPVCTSEFIAFARHADAFAEIGCELVGLSIDSLPSHLAWLEAIRSCFGINIPFPVIEDPSMVIARAYGMLDENAESSATIRGVYVVDTDGVIRAINWYPASIGRSIEELLRVVKALQTVDRDGVMTPEGWQPGGDVVLTGPVTQDEVTSAGPAWFFQYKQAKKK
ncbi:peroxiredoxin [Acetobacter sp. LMG 1627]|uniref:Alkyl hydroperoxide reductase C n=2 Tax=Acetobacter conturbans TaxID=1737472 RepID=A0ABX0K4F4_9PROT|nr:peroxiredoxin [Acetobacter conturbans]NHN89090.1 peroxiredoxin [Acetobacter conturbans]